MTVPESPTSAEAMTGPDAPDRTEPVAPYRRTTMYYDGGCPICMRGVAHFKRLDWARRIDWVDLIETPHALAERGVDFATAMEFLHVVDRAGQLRVGMPGFVALWHELPRYRHLARLLEALGAVPLADSLYRVTHRGRYLKRCREGVCAPTTRSR